jgi:hypothetical protein
VNFTASKSFDEATGVGNALNTKRYAINWQHQWNDNLSSTVNWNNSDDAYTGSTRNDDMDAYGVRLDYSVKRWFDVYASYAKDKRDSNFGNFNYSQNVWAIGFTASL